MFMTVGVAKRKQQGSRAAQRSRRPLQRKGDARELALLDATEELLGSDTLQDLTVEAIARRANVTRTAFYFYFASKEEAVGRLAERYLGEIYEAANVAFRPEIPIEQSVPQAIQNQVEVFAKHRALAAVADLAGTDPTIRELWRSSIEAFVEPLTWRMAEHQRDRGRRPSKDNRIRAEAMVWMLERYYRVWASGEYEHSPKAVADNLSEICMAMFDM
jgi:AcrR family transcriptional regulator